MSRQVMSQRLTHSSTQILSQTRIYITSIIVTKTHTRHQVFSQKHGTPIIVTNTDTTAISVTKTHTRHLNYYDYCHKDTQATSIIVKN